LLFVVSHVVRAPGVLYSFPTRRSSDLDVGFQRQPGCWLRSSHPFKECVIAHWSRGPAPKMSGAETRHRSSGTARLVEEHCMRGEAAPKGAVDCMEERMPE